MKKKTTLLLAIILIGMAAVCLKNCQTANMLQAPASATPKQGGSVIKIVSGKLKKSQNALKNQP